MYNIIEQCIEMEKQHCVTEDGAVVKMKPTHLLLNNEHYANILKSVGINSNNVPSPIKELYGLQVIFTNVPLETPRVLSITDDKKKGT